jgi:hypothetical protein
MVNLKAMLAQAKETTATQTASEEATNKGPVTAKAGLSIQLEGLEEVRAKTEAVFKGTPLGVFASAWCEKDISRMNYALAWVHAYVQSVAESLAQGVVTGTLVEHGGTHRKAKLSKALAASFASVVIASAKAGRLVNVQIGFPGYLKSVDPLRVIDMESFGGLNGENMQLVLQNPEFSYMGANHPVGLVALLDSQEVTVPLEDTMLYDNVYKAESAAFKKILKDHKTRVGFWKELRENSAMAGGDIVWDADDNTQDDNGAWADAAHKMRGRFIWTSKGNWGASLLPKNNETAIIYQRKEKKANANR